MNRAVGLAIAKSVTPGPVVAGGQITYTIVATNTGPSQAGNVTISDTLPAGVTLVTSSTLNGLTCSGTAVIRCSVPTLNVNSPVTLLITGTVAANTPDGVSITNTAAVTATEQTTAVPATASVDVDRQVTLEIDKSVTPGPVVAGGQITYTIVATNTGLSQASNVTISDTLPLSVTGVTSSTLGGLTCSGTAVIRCSVPTLNVNSPVTLLMTGTVAANTPDGVSITNTAAVTATEQTTPATDTASKTITTSADVTVSIAEEPAVGTLKVGDTLTYTVDITNNGLSVAKTVLVSVTLPISVAYVGVVPPASGFTGPAASGGKWIWSAASFAVGNTQLVFTGTITGTGVISTSVVIGSDTSDPVANNSASTPERTVPNQPPELNLQATETTGYITTTTGNLLIAPSALITDVDTPVFAGGILTVTIETGGDAADTLVISPTAPIAMSDGISVTHGGIEIGTYVAGAGVTAQLTVTFNSNATLARVVDLVHTIAFSNVVSPGIVDRLLHFTLSDGAGGVSAIQSITVVADQLGNGRSVLLPDGWPLPSAPEDETGAPLRLYLPLIGGYFSSQGAASDPPDPDTGLAPDGTLPESIYLPALQGD